jgi:signal peptidase I
VPEGQYYVLGDNAPRSRDSRVFGPIPGDSIFGRVAAVAWPTERIRVVR